MFEQLKVVVCTQLPASLLRLQARTVPILLTPLVADHLCRLFRILPRSLFLHRSVFLHSIDSSGGRLSLSLSSSLRRSLSFLGHFCFKTSGIDFLISFLCWVFFSFSASNGIPNDV